MPDALPSRPDAPGAAEMDALLRALELARARVSAVVLGQEAAVDLAFAGLIAGGHVLLEGPPGVGKTLLVRTLATVTGLSFSRIQFTPDLMPSDITGALALVPDAEGHRALQFQRGPIFAQLVLADEINRATPRTQSALLEAMQERTVSAGAATLALPAPFAVLATQNPIEMEGTYSLPEAQIDRFILRIDIGFPTEAVLSAVLRDTTGLEAAAPEAALTPGDILALQTLVRQVPIASHVRDAVARFALLTQPDGPRASQAVARHVRFGLSPRGAQALVLAAKAHALMRGRFNVAFDDLRAVLRPATIHRIHTTYEGRAAGARIEPLLQELLESSVAEFA
jgi:MoxR-like ATPase